MVARKELTEGNHQEWSLRLNCMGGGAWPFLVDGVICLVNSDNEGDLNLLTRHTIPE